MVYKRRISKRKSVRKNRKGSRRRSYKKMRGGACPSQTKAQIKSIVDQQGITTWGELLDNVNQEQLTECEITSLADLGISPAPVRTFGHLAVPPPPMTSYQSVEEPPSFAHVESVPETDKNSEPAALVAPSSGVKTAEEKNAEFFKRLREEEAAKKAAELEGLNSEQLEIRARQEAEAKAHEQSKTNHYGKLGSTFAAQGRGALQGRGRGRGPGGGSRRRQRGGGRGHGR